jgi:hypothetical protein
MPHIGAHDTINSLITRLDDLVGLTHTVTVAPALGDMEVGEIWIGDATESSPASGSDALYIKINEATIMVVRTDGTTIEGSNIT